MARNKEELLRRLNENIKNTVRQAPHADEISNKERQLSQLNAKVKNTAQNVQYTTKRKSDDDIGKRYADYMSGSSSDDRIASRRQDDDIGKRYADYMSGSSSDDRIASRRQDDDIGKRYADYMSGSDSLSGAAKHNAGSNRRDPRVLLDRLIVHRNKSETKLTELGPPTPKQTAKLWDIDMPVVQDIKRPDMSALTAIGIDKDAYGALWDIDMPMVQDVRKTDAEDYEGSVQQTQDWIDAILLAQRQHDLLSRFPHSTYESLPVTGEAMTKEEYDIAQANLAEDIAAVDSDVDPKWAAWYADKMKEARDLYSADPSAYAPEGEEYTEAEIDATLGRFDKDIASAEIQAEDALYADILRGASDELAARPDDYKNLNIGESHEIGANIMARRNTHELLRTELEKAEAELWQRQQRDKWDAYAREAEASDFRFLQYDYYRFKQRELEKQGKSAMLGYSSVRDDHRDRYTYDEAYLYEYLRTQYGQKLADEYKDYLQPIVAARINGENIEAMKLEDRSLVYNAVGSAMFNLGKIENTLDIAIQRADRLLTGSNKPIDYQTTGGAGQLSNAMREVNTERLAELGDINDWLGTDIAFLDGVGVDDFYNAGQDFLNSAVNTIVFGKAWAGSAMGLEKYSDEYADAIERGGTETQAVRYAAASAFAEGIGEGLEVSSYLKMIDKIGRAPGWMAKVGYGILQTLEGGAGEGLTTKLEQTADKWFMGENSEFELLVKMYEPMVGIEMARTIAQDKAEREILMSVLMGIVGQGVPTAVGGTVSSIVNPYSVGADIRNLGNEQTLADLMGMATGEDVNTPRTAYGTGLMYNDLINNGTQYADKIAQEERDQAVTEYLERMRNADGGKRQTSEVDDAVNEKIRQALLRAGRGKQLTGRQQALVASDGSAQATLDAIRSDTLNVDNRRSVAAKTASELAYVLPAYEVRPVIKGTTAAAKEQAEKRMLETKVDATAEDSTVNGEKVTVLGLGQVAENDGVGTVKVSDDAGNTREVSVNDVTFNDTHTAEVYNYAQDMATPELAQAFIDTVDSTNEPIEYVANGMQHAYEMAFNGYTNINTVRTSPMTTGITRQQLQTAYDLGVKDRAAQIAIRKERARKRQQANANKRWQSGRIQMGDVVMEGLSEEQKRDLDIVDVIARLFGVNIQLYESKANESGVYQGERGSYDPKTNTIRLDVRAGVDKVGDSYANTTMLKTVAHELTHSLQRNAPEQYEAYKNAVLDVLEKNGKNTEKMADERMAEDSRLTREAAIDEIVADASETMLHDSDALERLRELHPEEAKNFVQKVLDILKRIKDAIREAFEGVKLSEEAQAIMSDIDRLAAQWSDLAVESAEVSGREIEISADVQQKINNDQAIDGVDEIKNSIRHDEKYMAAAVKLNRALGFVTAETVRGAEKARVTVRDFFRDPKNTKLLKLPADVTGKTFYANSSYDGSEENTTVCIRSMAAQQLMDAVAKDLGRPLTLQDTLLISQEIAALTDRPECFYCYVATDRRAYREYMGDYLKQRDEVIRKYQAGADREALYQEFLDGRKPTDNMEARFDMWLEAVDKGVELITGKDLASLEELFAEIGGRKKKKKPTTSRLDQLQDAAAYAQSASWAKKMNGYAAYNNHILKWTQKRVDDLNKGYGLRMYSFSDYSPAFVLENMQMITDAAVRGLNVLAYTKEMDFAEIFAPSGANINISVFATEVNGQITSDAMQGADWARAQALRSKYDNVGTVMVATNDRIMKWAMEQDWIDVVIPYHLVRTGKQVAKYFGYKDYTSVSADKKTLSYKSGDPTSVSPVEHRNDIAAYVDALQRYGLTPRFEDQINGYVDYVSGDITAAQFREMNPYYMKLVNETRRSYADTKPVQPIFDTDAAMSSIDTMIKQGGYYQPIGGSMEKQTDIAEEIAGKIRDNDSVRYSNNPDIRYSTRRADNISDRELLANVLAGAVQNETERELVEEYQSKLESLTSDQKLLDDARATIRELAFKPRSEYAEGDLQRLETARVDAKKLAGRLARADKQLLKLQAMQPVKNVLARARQQAEIKMRKRKDEQLKKYRDRRDATALRKTVIRKASNLDKLLRNPSDKRHLPEGLRKPVLDLMEVFTSMDDAFGGGQDALAKLATCRRAYDRMKQEADNPNGTSNYAAGKYDDGISARMQMLEETIGEKREGGLYELTGDELRKISAILDHFDFLSREGNKEFINGKRVATGKILSDLYDIMYDESTGRPKYNAGKNILQKIKLVGDKANGLHISNMTPVYFSRMMGGPLEQLMNNIIDADATFGLNYARAQVRMAEIHDEFHYDSWANDNKDRLTIHSEDGDEIKLTREQALCIWATDKRERGSDVPTKHLALGGIIFDEKAAKSNFDGEVAKSTGSPLSRETLTQINDWLTDEQKRYADTMVAYVSNDMARLGNETSMELHGYRKFREGGYYFPFRTPSDFIRKEAGRSIDVAMYKNEGFTKPLQKGASTPVLVTDFSDAIANHVERMCKYNALAGPQDTLQRILNYKAEQNVSVESLIRGYYGSGDVVNYMRQFLSDIHDKGRGSTAPIARAAEKMASLNRRASVMGSASTVIQQPSALPRAMSMVNPKYFRSPVGTLTAFEEAKKYSGVCVLKDMGGFDAGTSVSNTDWLLGRSDEWFRKHGTKWDTAKQLNNKVWSVAPEFMDKITWGEIWSAVKREQADKTGLNINSEELMQIAGKRMDEVCKRTQVYDSVMVKSQNMREGGWAKALTAFMAEPTVTYNMVADALREGLNGHPKAMLGTMAAVVASVIYNNVLKSIVMAARDDDDEKAPYYERYFRALLDGAVNDMVVFNYMPIAKDIWSMFMGYDVERPDMSIITKGLSFITAIGNEDKSLDEKLYTAAQFVGQVVPIPVGNLWREWRAVKNTFGKAARSDNEDRDNWLKYAWRDAMHSNTPLYHKFGPNDAERLYSAALAGDDAAVAEQRQYMIDYKGKDDKQINSSLRTEVKNGYLDGDIDEERAIGMLTDYAGMEPDDAYMKVEEWDYEWSGNGDWKKTAKLTDAIDAGDSGAIQDAVDELLEYGGYDTPKKGAQTLASNITSTYKPLYIAASPAERRRMEEDLLDAYEIVYTTAGEDFDREDRRELIHNWLD